MRTRKGKLLVMLLLGGLVAAAFAQPLAGGRRRGRVVDSAAPIERGDVPTWPFDERFPRDVFTFARIKYSSSAPERSSFAWFTDYPDADLNLSFRLQQLTCMKVRPEPKVVELTDPTLFDYPWIFMSGVGNIVLTDFEAQTLRSYLLNGGFMMVDDFWGRVEWEGFYRAIKQVLPEYEPVDLPRDHAIFNSVYKLPPDLPLQTCNIRAAVANKDRGITWEDGHAGGDTHDAHFRAILDSKNRIMVMICHNTDNGDGWEEESGDPWFFSTFSEKKNYPLAINIIFYSMTH